MDSEEILWSTVEAYEAMASSYRRRAWDIVKRVAKLCREMGTFLDAGCGPGHNAVLLLSEYPKARGVLVDLSKAMVKRAQSSIELAGLKHRALLVVSDVRSLPLRSESMELCLYIAVIHHLPERAWRINALREAWRVLKDSGVALITSWSIAQRSFVKCVAMNFFKKLVKPSISLGDCIKVSIVRGTTYRRYYHLYTLGELKRDVQGSGFIVVQAGKYIALGRAVALQKNLFVVGLKKFIKG
ncbi:MAG: class I SAM-dependent methyltransferase [Desulfurococcaceae archaeon]|nr:class I SAM-dependent methyltransferase [Sulfolobales archaeon]MDW8169571.1 class I SAM-dependent methyltransferase [Desulfurococcaceae archaeon]